MGFELVLTGSYSYQGREKPSYGPDWTPLSTWGIIVLRVEKGVKVWAYLKMFTMSCVAYYFRLQLQGKHKSKRKQKRRKKGLLSSSLAHSNGERVVGQRSCVIYVGAGEGRQGREGDLIT